MEGMRYGVLKGNFRRDQHLVRLNEAGFWYVICGRPLPGGVEAYGYVLSEVGCRKCRASHEYQLLKKYGKRDLSQNNIVLRM